MKKIKILLSGLAIGSMGLLSGCSQPPCISETGHEWGLWQDIWDRPSDAGGVQQTRTCSKCGLVTVEVHF